MYNSELSIIIHLVFFLFFYFFIFFVQTLRSMSQLFLRRSPMLKILPTPLLSFIPLPAAASCVQETSAQSWKSLAATKAVGAAGITYLVYNTHRVHCTHSHAHCMRTHTLGTQVPPASTLVQLRWTLSLLKTLQTPSFPTASTLC